ncbi:A32.5L, partial [Monkeypox virus]
VITALLVKNYPIKDE